MRLLKQSTATTLALGPFLDATDGVTAETALTIAQADVLLWKEGGTSLAQKNDSTSCTHRSSGIYTCPANATDTATLGTLVVSVSKSGAMPIRQDYLVVPANVYDSFVSGSDLLQVDVQAINDSTTAADLLQAVNDTMVTGIVDSTGFTPTTSAFETSSITTAASSHWVGRVVIFRDATLGKAAGRITAYSLVGGRGHFTIDAQPSAPQNGGAFVIV